VCFLDEGLERPAPTLSFLRQAVARTLAGQCLASGTLSFGERSVRRSRPRIGRAMAARRGAGAAVEINPFT
jgi:hypothetical protein